MRTGRCLRQGWAAVAGPSPCHPRRRNALVGAERRAVSRSTAARARATLHLTGSRRRRPCNTWGGAGARAMVLPSTARRRHWQRHGHRHSAAGCSRVNSSNARGYLCCCSCGSGRCRRRACAGVLPCFLGRGLRDTARASEAVVADSGSRDCCCGLRRLRCHGNGGAARPADCLGAARARARASCRPALPRNVALLGDCFLHRGIGSRSKGFQHSLT